MTNLIRPGALNGDAPGDEERHSELREPLEGLPRWLDGQGYPEHRQHTGAARAAAVIRVLAFPISTLSAAYILLAISLCPPPLTCVTLDCAPLLHT